MVESQLRELYEQLASTEPPPSRADVGLAVSRGRRRFRVRRAGIASAPVVAAAAVAGVILAVGATPGIPARVGTTPPVGSSPRPAQPAQAPSRFNPLIPYASFGWLPAGQTLTAGGTGRTEMYVNAGPKRGKTVWSLTFYSAGRCQLSRAQKGMDCSYSASGGQTASITGRAPAVRGHRAFWAGGYLIWQYARGGWALLSFPSRHDALKVAAHVRYGVGAAPPIVFPAQLTGVPRIWQVSSVAYRPDAGVLRASQYSLTAGAVALAAGSGEFRPNIPDLDTDPATSHSSCRFYPNGQSTRAVVAGYKVVINHWSGLQQLCAAHAHGLAVFIDEAGRHPAIGVIALFGRHLRLLGANPASWTKVPIS
jgi:hypothetical protein